MLEASIGGILFEGAPADPTEAFVIDPEGWSGWDEGVTMRRDETARPGTHGAFDAPGFMSARVVSISGWIIAPTPSALATMRTQLTGLLSDGGSDTLTVETAAGETWAEVRLAGQTAVTVQGSETEARFQVQFWSPDPRRYGAAHSFGPGASLTTVEHDGNFPAIPIVTVAGAVTAPYTVASQGHSVTVTQSVTSGHEHTIDMGTGWVYLDGVLQSGVTSAVDVFTIPPGGPVTVTGPSTMTVDVVDTYS
jgi:phage-related protein